MRRWTAMSEARALHGAQRSYPHVCLLAAPQRSCRPPSPRSSRCFIGKPTPCTSLLLLCRMQDFLAFPSACRCCRSAAHPSVNGGSLPLPSACGAQLP